jgi:hypothetical protein
MKATIIAILLGLAPAAHAQSLSVADIAAQVDKDMASLDEYATLLNDPDPRRARKAMQIMLGSGDAELERLALDYGLFSTDPGVRRVVLDAWLATGPMLEIRYDGATADLGRMREQLENRGGSVTDAGKGVLLAQIGDFDAERGCYQWQDRTECALRVTDETVAIQSFEKWSTLELGPDGFIRGPIFINRVGLVPGEIPITR